DGGARMLLSCGGHPLPLVLRRSGAVEPVGRLGTLLGADVTPVLADVAVELAPGELLVLYTDGVVEARGPSGVFGEERLRVLLSDLVGDAPTRVVQRIEAAVLAASGGRPRDDLAIVALRVRRPRA
ncbi:MAG: serine/threonine-protein phosphatase, partial [Actinomycetota bacterium]|nr:serine/threonine-protein phosphatase [Actinomycetota bacterium]